MAFSKIIHLGRNIPKIEKGEPFPELTFSKVFANQKSIRSSEFYDSARVGLKPELCFEIYEDEYNNEEYVKYNDILYIVVRTYKPLHKNFIELYLQKDIGG